MTKYPAEWYTTDEITAMLHAANTGWGGERLQALIIVLWRSGLRLAEALALVPSDIDFVGKTIRVRHGKGDKARTVGMDDREAAELKRWLELRGHFPPDVPVFCTRKGTPLQAAWVRRTLPELARRAGVHKRVHAHGFRHTFAVELLRAGVSVRHIQQLLGHTSLNTTSIYLASLSPEEALDAVRGRTW
jgi:site-specific recombinase XerD